MQILQTKTTRLEENYYDMFQEAQTTSSAVTILEATTMMEEKLDNLEGFSRRDNLKFLNISQLADEDYETCVMKVVSILQDSVPNRQWCRADIVRAHRLGSNTSDKSRNGFSKPQPMIVQFTRWSDKMDVLTKGREALKKKGVTVAGDLTTKQQNTIREHRERGLRAYYKGNRLVVAGPLQYHPLNRGSFADATRRGASRGRLNPGDGRHTACQQGNPGTNVRHQTSRPREEYDSRPYHPEDGNFHWSRGTRHSGDNRTTDWQNEYRGNIDNHHYDPWTRQYYNSGSSKDWDSEWYDQRPYPDWQDYDRRPNAFPSLDMPARNSRNLTPVAAQSDGDTNHLGKQYRDKGNALGAGTPETIPSVADKEPPVFGPPAFLQSEGSPLKDSAQPTPERPEEPGNEDVRTEGGQTTETPPACDQTVENTQTAYQENDTANRNPPQRDTPTADSDAKFHDAEESLEDTKGTESACTGLENTQVTTIAPTCHDAESADAETPECSRPTTEPCTQGTDVTDLTAKQPGEETHMQSGLHGVQAGSGGPAKRLRSSSVVCEGEKRQLTLTETMAKKANKQSAPKPAGTTNTTQSAGATE